MGSEKLESFRLGERCSIKSSKRIFAREYVEAGVPFWRSKDVIDKSLGVFQQFDLYISKERFNEISGKYGSPQKGDLLISSVGNRSGQPYVVQEEGEFYFKDGNILWINDFVELDAEFLSYWLKSSKGQAALSSVMIGSAQKALTIDALRSLQVHLPVYEMQLSAVKMLKILDNKITLNRQINQTLEQMAQTLFKSWFVDFDPVIDNALDAGNAIPDELQARAEQRQALRHAVNEANKANAANLPHGTHTNPAAGDGLASPYKPLPDDVRQLFPNEFEESELGWVPKGWKAEDLGKYISFANGKSHKSIEDGKYPLFGANGIIGSSNEAKFNKAVIVGRVGAYCGAVEYCSGGFWASDNTIVADAKKNPNHVSFVLFLLKHMNLNKYAGGAAQPLLNQRTLSQLIFAFASSEIMSLFAEWADKILQKIVSNKEQNRSLSNIRDTLLPKLISGELRLDDVESTIEETITATTA